MYLILVNVCIYMNKLLDNLYTHLCISVVDYFLNYWQLLIIYQYLFSRHYVLRFVIQDIYYSKENNDQNYDMWWIINDSKIISTLYVCIFFLNFKFAENIFEMRDTSGRNCTAIWSFFSQTSFIEKKIRIHSRCVDLRISFFFFPFSFLLFRLVTNADLRPVILSEFHELGDSLPESIQQEAKISALWNVNPRKWKENTRQLWLTIPASPLDVLKTIQRYKFVICYKYSTR